MHVYKSLPSLIEQKKKKNTYKSKDIVIANEL